MSMLSRFTKKWELTYDEEEEALVTEYFEPQFLEVDKVIAVRDVTGAETEGPAAAMRATVDKKKEADDTADGDGAGASAGAGAGAGASGGDDKDTEMEAADADSASGSKAKQREKKQLFLVKWCYLPYTECTWETREELDEDAAIERFRTVNQLPKDPKVVIDYSLCPSLSKRATFDPLPHGTDAQARARGILRALLPDNVRSRERALLLMARWSHRTTFPVCMCVALCGVCLTAA